MLKRNLLSLLLLLSAIFTQAQSNFVYSPEKPKPGDVITFTYTPAGDIANTILPVEGVLYQSGLKGRKADDLVLEKKAGKYTGSFTADTGMNFLYFAFTSNKKTDNNFNDGYYIILYENDKPASGAYFNLGSFYQFMGRNVGLTPNNEKALSAMEKEFEFYPDNRKLYTLSYIRLQTVVKKDDAAKILQKEIESLLKTGLKDESDYGNLEGLYQLAKLPEQGKFIGNVKKEKFPNGSWTVNETLMKYNSEKDPEKKKQLFKEMEAKLKSGDEKWALMKDLLPNYKSQMLYEYINAKKNGMNSNKR